MPQKKSLAGKLGCPNFSPGILSAHISPSAVYVYLYLSFRYVYTAAYGLDMAHIIVKCRRQQQVGMQFDDLEVGRHFDDAIQLAELWAYVILDA